MIFDSHYWRRELRRSIADINIRTRQGRWTEATFGNFERSLMTGFYTVRKLMESKLASAKLTGTNWPLTAFPFKGGHIGAHLIWPDIPERYDLASPKKVSKATGFIANQFIHSYVFTPSFDNSGTLNGVFVSSETEAPKHVFWAPITTIAKIFTTVAGSRGMPFRIAPHRNRIKYP